MHVDRFRIRLAVGLAVLAGLGLGNVGPARAARGSGIQLSPGSNRYFINKDVNGERWSITYNLDDKTVTGNVFPTDGGPPTFLSCNITRVEQAPNPADSQYFLECRTAGSCETAPCNDQWGAPFDAGSLPGSFLLPSETKATLAGSVQPIFSGSCATSAVCHGNGSSYVILANGAAWRNTFLVQSNGVNGAQGPFVSPFDPGASFLFHKVEGTGAGERMPYNGSPLPAAQIDAIRNWILEGAANN